MQLCLQLYPQSDSVLSASKLLFSLLPSISISSNPENFRHALDEYTIVANSFRYQQMFTNQLFFALVDFDEAQDVFQQVCYTQLQKFLENYYNISYLA